MMELYQRHIHGIQSICNQIEGIQGKIIFLIEEKKNFRLLNKNDDAEIVLQWYSDEIDKFKLLLQFDSQAKLNSDQQNSGKLDDIQTLSVSDWSIVFYYLDETGTKEGNKIDRMEKFIKENKVLSPSGILTTKGFFKKEYHEIENRINGKNDKKPLPPERIENILHFLKNNKKALEAAESDIEHLTYEIKENERNTY